MALSDAFADQLRANRKAFNERFAVAQRHFNTLDGDDFLRVMASHLDPLVAAIHMTAPERVPATTLAAYDAALALTGHDLLGVRSRVPEMSMLWRAVLPALAAFVAADPQRVIGALGNALANLAAIPGARPGAWLEMVRASAATLSQDGAVTEGRLVALLEAGQIAAWRAGAAHYRAGALSLLARANPALAAGLLDIGGQGNLMKDVLARLRHDPWWDPAAPATSQPSLRVVRRVGAFRGFGGPFVEPPRVATAGEHFVITSGDERFLLTADVFGATLHRVAATSDGAGPGPWALSPAGDVRIGALSAALPELAASTSAAGNDTTLAVTTRLTHSVMLVAASQAVHA